MKQILILEASPRGAESASRKVTANLRKRLEERYPEAKVVARDLTKDNLPSLDDEAIKAIATKNTSRPKTAAIADELIDELLASDLLVVATPMWNFGIPPMVKAWLDLVIRAGTTFRYTEMGAEGLTEGKAAILIISSGGVFSEGVWKTFDFVEPYLRLVLKFIGIENIQTVRVEGLNIPPLAAMAIPNAESALDQIAY